MLVLTRRIGESIVIDHEVAIKVLDVRGGQIRLGIEAPENIAVLREELCASILPESSTTDIEC